MKINYRIANEVDNLLIKKTDYIPPKPLQEVLNPQWVKCVTNKQGEHLIQAFDEIKLTLSANNGINSLYKQPKSNFESLYKFKPLAQKRQNEYIKTINQIKDLLNVKGIERYNYKEIIHKCKKSNGKIDNEKLSLVINILGHKKITENIDYNYVLDSFKHQNAKSYDLKALRAAKNLLYNDKINNVNELCTPFNRIFVKNRKFKAREYDTYNNILSSKLVNSGKEAQKLFGYCYTPTGHFIPKVAKFMDSANYSDLQYKFNISNNLIDYMEVCKGFHNEIDDEIFEYGQKTLKNPKIKEAKHLITPMNHLKRFIQITRNSEDAKDHFNKLLKCKELKTGEDFENIINLCIDPKEKVLDLNLVELATNELEKNNRLKTSDVIEILSDLNSNKLKQYSKTQ